MIENQNTNNQLKLYKFNSTPSGLSIWEQTYKTVKIEAPLKIIENIV